MDMRIAGSAQQLVVAGNLFLKAVHEVPTGDERRTPNEHTNPLLWIAGHVTQTRGRLLGILQKTLGDNPSPIPFGELFATGSEPSETGTYPALAEIAEQFRTISGQLQAALERLTAEQLATALTIRVPSEDGTLAGAIAFFAFHDAYHVGQMGYLRRWLGMPGIVGR